MNVYYTTSARYKNKKMKAHGKIMTKISKENFKLLSLKLKNLK